MVEGPVQGGDNDIKKDEPISLENNIADIEKVRKRFIEAFGDNFVITEECFKEDSSFC